MAYAVEVTLVTGNKVSLNYQSQEVSVSITYQLESEDGDVLAVVAEKTNELVAAHALAWKRVKGAQPVTIEKTENVETGHGDSDQKEAPVSGKSSTAAQVQLIYSLCLQAGLTKDQLERRIQTTYGYELPEELNHNQAATLIVELGQEERDRFNMHR